MKRPITAMLIISLLVALFAVTGTNKSANAKTSYESPLGFGFGCEKTMTTSPNT